MAEYATSVYGLCGQIQCQSSHLQMIYGLVVSLTNCQFLPFPNSYVLISHHYPHCYTVSSSCIHAMVMFQIQIICNIAWLKMLCSTM